MALVLSIGISLVAGVAVMYQTQYFWGKEDNSNINTMNNSMNSLTASFGTVSVLSTIVIVIVLAGALMLLCSCRGF